MLHPYRFLNTHVQSATMNMAIDEAVLLHHLRGEAPPTLRVFRWAAPSISLGRFQSVEREILRDTCERQGIELVRRPTGGTAHQFDPLPLARVAQDFAFDALETSQ